MKKLFIGFLPWLFTAFGYKAIAQEDTKDKKKETQEIIIRKKGDKDANITVQINGDNVLINGKPLSEFKDGEITINNRKMSIHDGDGFMFNGDWADLEDGGMGWSKGMNDNKAFLGVSTEKSDGGAKITEITKESAAEKAGLEKGDIITKVNDIKVDGPQSLYDAITSMKPKDEVKVYYKRGSKEKSVKATLQEKKGPRTFSVTTPDGSYKTLTIPQIKSWDNMDPVVPELPEGLNDFNYSYSFPRQQKLGLKIQDTEEGTGVKVLDVDENSAAAKAGMKEDDIITEIGGKKIINTDEARTELKANKDKSSYSIKARRDGKEMTFELKIPKKLKTANL